MVQKKDPLSDIAYLLEKAELAIKNTKKAQKKKASCSSCGKTPTVYRGLCQVCIDIERNKKQENAVGKRWISTNGYEYIYQDGMKPALYHRVRMEQLLGRPLQAHEQVGHKNGMKADNADENLILTVKSGFDLSTLSCHHCDQPYILFSAATASS